MALNLASLVDAARQRSGEVWVPLVEVDEPTLAAPIRLVRYDVDVVSNGETYVAAPGLDVVAASQEDGSDGRAKLLLPAAEQSILDLLENFASQASVTLRLVMLSDPDEVLVETSNLRILSHTTNRRSIEITLGGPRYLDDAVPSDRMTRLRVPGAFV